MKTTIIIPAFNAEKTLRSAVLSALGQSVSDLEVVVVDDGSSDGSLEVARSIADPRVRVVALARNQGLPAARNRGIEVSTTPLVSFLDADDLMLPNYVLEMAQALVRQPGSALAFPDAWIYDAGRRRIRRQTACEAAGENSPLAVAGDELVRSLLEKNRVFVAATVRRQAWASVGGFDESLNACEDWDLWIRLAATGIGFAKVPKPLVVYRRESGQMSSDSERMAVAQAAVRSKHVGLLGDKPLAIPQGQGGKESKLQFVQTAARKAVPGGIREFRGHRFRAPAIVRETVEQVTEGSDSSWALAGVPLLGRKGAPVKRADLHTEPR